MKKIRLNKICIFCYIQILVFKQIYYVFPFFYLKQVQYSCLQLQDYCLYKTLRSPFPIKPIICLKVKDQKFCIFLLHRSFPLLRRIVVFLYSQFIFSGFIFNFGHIQQKVIFNRWVKLCNVKICKSVFWFVGQIFKQIFNYICVPKLINATFLCNSLND